MTQQFDLKSIIESIRVYILSFHVFSRLPRACIYIIENDIFRIGFSSAKNAIFFMVKWAIEFGANVFVELSK